MTHKVTRLAVWIFLAASAFAESKTNLHRASPPANRSVALSFPCDLTKFSKLPEVTIYGEKHAYEYYVQNQALLTEDAAKGNSYLALEGELPGVPVTYHRYYRHWGTWPEASSQVRGYDDELQNGILSAMMIYQNLKASGNGAIDPLWLGYIGMIFGRNPLAGEVLETAIAIGHWDDNGLKIIDDFRKLSKMRDMADAKKITDSWNSSSPFYKNTKQRNEIYHQFLRSFIQLAKKEPYKTTKRVPPNLETLVDTWLRNPGDEATFAQMTDAWREPMMRQNLANLYCEAAQNGKPLNIVAGISHMNSIANALSAASGKKITIRTNDVFGELQALSSQLRNKTFSHPSSVEARKKWLSPLSRMLAENASKLSPRGPVTLDVPLSSGGVGQMQLSWPPHGDQPFAP